MRASARSRRAGRQAEIGNLFLALVQCPSMHPWTVGVVQRLRVDLLLRPAKRTGARATYDV
jgi:hypothetical protein